jgi:hypothetical protein
MAGRPVPRSAPGASTPAFGPLQWAIIALTVATAAIHLYLAFVVMPGLTGRVDPLFLLNGLGYLALVAALYMPASFLVRWRPLVRWLLLGYTLLTVLIWFVLTQFAGTERTMLGYVDKAIEIALIVLLFIESQRAPQA